MSKPSDYRRTGCLFVIACLVIAVALFGLIKSSQESETENASAGNVATDLADNGANLTDDKIDNPAPPTGANAAGD